MARSKEKGVSGELVKRNTLNGCGGLLWIIFSVVRRKYVKHVNGLDGNSSVGGSTSNCCQDTSQSLG